VTVTPLGTLTLADAFPGFARALEDVNAAFARLAAVVNAQASILLDVHGAVKLAALAGLQASLDATVALGANLSLSLSDPAAAIAGLLVGIGQVSANIQLLVPSLAVAGQVSANLTVAAELQAKVSALTAVLDALLEVSATLTAAIALPALSLTLDASVSLFVYRGTVASFGTELQAALSADPTIGALPGGSGNVTIHAPVLVARADDGGALRALQSVMRLA
jgi:hypothetical protein